jgi:hypothetical protein
MPFADQMRPVYDAIREALQSHDVGFAVVRADELFGGDQVMSGVLREMARAQLVIADLTGRNPNVFYELGIAHMTKEAKRVLLLTQSMADVPFDLSAYRCIPYTADPTGLERLRKQVASTAKALAGTVYPFTLKEGETLRTDPMFPGPDRHLYSLELSARHIGFEFVKCWVKAWKHGLGVEPVNVEDDSYGFNEGESRPINGFPWLVRLDRISERSASFSVVPPEGHGRT